MGPLESFRSGKQHRMAALFSVLTHLTVVPAITLMVCRLIFKVLYETLTAESVATIGPMATANKA